MVRASSGSLSASNFHYYVDLANGLNYTPPARSNLLFLIEGGGIDSDAQKIELYDGAGWVSATSGTPQGNWLTILQDNDQSVRFLQVAGGPKKISLTGWVWG